MAADFKIEGIPETLRLMNLWDMEKKAKSIALIKVTAVQVKNDGKANAPKSPSNRRKETGKSGDLKRSINIKYKELGLRATIGPSKPKGWYRGIVEKGTKPRTSRKGYRGVGPAQPFMKPAEEKAAASYNTLLAAIYLKDTTI